MNALATDRARWANAFATQRGVQKIVAPKRKFNARVTATNKACATPTGNATATPVSVAVIAPRPCHARLAARYTASASMAAAFANPGTPVQTARLPFLPRPKLRAPWHRRSTRQERNARTSAATTDSAWKESAFANLVTMVSTAPVW
jgi:hypothetical protein